MNNVWVLLLLLFIGFVIVALPDNNERLFSISRDHGPSLQDAIGLIFIAIGYTGLAGKVWKQRRRIFLYKHTKIFQLCLFIFGLGAGLIIASIAADFCHWWVVGAAMLMVVQAISFYKALK